MGPVHRHDHRVTYSECTDGNHVSQIRMFFHDTDKHHLPHIHADYQGEVAVYAIEDGSVVAGSRTG